ncbi:vacuolar ATPase assembly integral membrane protein vma21 [Microsporum ferrugineum]
MATRRGASKETQPEISSPRPSQPTGPEFRRLPGGVLWKFILYSVLVVCCPLGTYYGTLNRVFEGNSTYAGAAAAGAANIVLIVYIIFAIREDNEIEKKAEEEFKKNR